MDGCIRGAWEIKECMAHLLGIGFNQGTTDLYYVQQTLHASSLLFMSCYGTRFDMEEVAF